MASLSVSLPQTLLPQARISADATAVPCLKVLPPLAWTRTMTCWPDPVQPTEVKPEPWATPDPAFWLTLTKTSALLVPLQVTSSGTSTAAPRATSLAGDSTWTSRNSPPEKNATADRRWRTARAGRRERCDHRGGSPSAQLGSHRVPLLGRGWMAAGQERCRVQGAPGRPAASR